MWTSEKVLNEKGGLLSFFSGTGQQTFVRMATKKSQSNWEKTFQFWKERVSFAFYIITSLVGLSTFYILIYSSFLKPEQKNEPPPNTAILNNHINVYIINETDSGIRMLQTIKQGSEEVISN